MITNNKSALDRDLFLFYIYQFFSNLDFARGIFALYLLSKGLNGLQIGVVQTILFLSSLIFEVPTGIIADKWNRKSTILLGLLICAIVPILMALNSNVWAFFLIFALLGLGYSLESGADIAMLYERVTTLAQNENMDFKKILGSARSIRYFALAIAVLCGGFLQSFGWHLVFGLVSISIIFAMFAILSFNDTAGSKTNKKEDTSRRKASQIAKQLHSFFNSKKGRELFWLILVIVFIQAATTPLFIYAQLLFNSYHLNTPLIGFIIASGLVTSSLAYKSAHKIAINNEFRFIAFLCVILTLILGIFITRPPVYISVFLYLSLQAIPPILIIHLMNVLNTQISSEIRASCLSFQNFLSAFLLSLSNLIFGKLIDLTSIGEAIGYLTILPLISIFCLFLYRRIKLPEVEVNE